ncbi:DUF2357 domain-containing protein [Clostridium sp. KNHs214]|uniref:DUF2357 domain-containing protein n=1 Tax=Clostridium sp. KNHs214 TaxID=1540257 RepID=UPI00054CE6B1|nr:DUF2357 domain-containing protein [Clostridium sp. KNHs214]
MECRLILQSKLTNEVDITLTEIVENNIFLANESCGVVYSNLEYSAKIYFDKDIQNIKFYVNDTLRKSYYCDGKIYFNDDNFLDNRIFLNYFGYVSIKVFIEGNDGNYEFYSDYLDVAVRDNVSSNNIRKMIDYIAENSQKYLFQKDDKVKDFADVIKSKNKNIVTEISILENIIFEYEKNFKYYKTSAKYKIKSNYIVDDFEKVKEINNETIQYIISNPQQLITVNYNTGIRYHKLNLQPKKTLINKNELCYDIYENKIIVGFLKYIYNSLIDKIAYVESQNNKQQKYYINVGYVSLSNEIYTKLNDTLNKYRKKIYDIKNKVQQLYFMYKQTLKCEEITISGIPNPTAIFMEIQHYRKIYKVIRDWFEGGNYNFEREKMILTFSEASQIYEYYVLFNLNNYIIENGYYLKKPKKFLYTLKKSAKYVNTRFENTFVFEKSGTNITVYYQPVIYLDQVFNDIGLFRNNDISLNGEKAQYYTPDYVIKINKEGLSEFIILDAKWSTNKSVINYRFKEIVYKYIFSISTVHNNDKISKVWVINGQEIEDQKENIYNFYNSKFKSRNDELQPSAKIITLNPNVDVIMQKNFLNQLFSSNWTRKNI